MPGRIHWAAGAVAITLLAVVPPQVTAGSKTARSDAVSPLFAIPAPS
jgi:hypothetical protein